MENNSVVPVSSIKLDTTAKGLVVPTIHIYIGATEEQLNEIRKMAINQFKLTIAEIEKEGFTTVVNAG